MIKHMSIGFGLLNQYNDTQLEEFFPERTATELRQWVADERAKGVKFFPCGCDEVNPDGSCKGWEGK